MGNERGCQPAEMIHPAEMEWPPEQTISYPELYATKPIAIEAIQFDGGNFLEIAKWIAMPQVGRSIVVEQLTQFCEVMVNHDRSMMSFPWLEKTIYVLRSHWVIKDGWGNFSMCNPYEFNLKYIKEEAKND